jgi:hypothetical protein
MTKLQTMTFRIDGVRYTLRPGQITGEDFRLFRSDTGQPLQIFDAATSTMGIDTLAAMIWIARRQAGERKLSYLDVEKSLTLESVQSLEVDIEDDELRAGEIEDPNE